MLTLPKVKNMTSPRSGEPVKNQFIIEQGSKEIFQSYNTVIAIKDFDTQKIVLDTNAYDYSATTSRYLNQFLGMGKHSVLKHINDFGNKSDITYEDLNS